MPLRRSCADILVVYLLSAFVCASLKGQRRSPPPSIRASLTVSGTTSAVWAVVTSIRHHMFVYDVPHGSRTRQRWLPNTNLCRPTRREGRSWSIHVMISRGGSNQAPMKHTDLREMFGSVKEGQREAEGPVRQEVHVRIQVLLVCWQSFTSSLTFHGEQRRAVMTDWCPAEGRTPLMALLRFSVPAFRNVLMNWQQFVSS